MRKKQLKNENIFLSFSRYSHTLVYILLEIVKVYWDTPPTRVPPKMHQSIWITNQLIGFHMRRSFNEMCFQKYTKWTLKIIIQIIPMLEMYFCAVCTDN